MLESRWCLLIVKIDKPTVYDIAKIDLNVLQLSLIKIALRYPNDLSSALDGCINMSRQRWSYYRKKYKQHKINIKDLSISVLQDLIIIGINLQNLEHKEGKEKHE